MNAADGSALKTLPELTVNAENPPECTRLSHKNQNQNQKTLIVYCLRKTIQTILFLTSGRSWGAGDRLSSCSGLLQLLSRNGYQ